MWLPFTLAGLLLVQMPARDAARHAADLLHAARTGDAARVAELVTGGRPVDSRDRRGMTPLMWASAGGYLPIVEVLLDRGAGVNLRAEDGSTALSFAAESGTGSVVAALLARGADVAAARAGATPQAIARARGHLELADQLQRLEALGAELLGAARTGNTTLVRQLLALGAPVNTSDEAGVTVLMRAAGDGHLGLLQYLLARGADAAQRDDAGRSVVEWAERSPGIGPHVVAYLAARGVARTGAPAERAVPPPALRTSLESLAVLLDRLAERPQTAGRAHQRAADALAELTSLSARWPADSPEDYRASLDALVVTVADTIAGDDPRAIEAALEALAEDLETKLEHCLESGGRLGGSVLVRVRTLRGSEEVRHWQIFYMPRIFETSATARPDLFPRLSSPSEELMVPGRYLVWVREPTSGVVSPRTIVKVGEGRKELDVDLPVPPGQP